MILIIFGASGTGKTTLVDMLVNSGSKYTVQTKDTSREAREYDDIEINCVKNFDPNNYNYVYQTYGHKYGFNCDDIEHSIAKNNHHLIICNDISTIHSIKQDYGSVVKVIFHYLDVAEDEIYKIQSKRGISNKEIDLRIAKVDVLYRQFIEEYDLFDACTKNTFGSIDAMKLEFQSLLVKLTKKESTSDLLNQLSSIASGIEKQNVKNRKPVSQKDYAFIIMKIATEEPENQDVHDAIMRACLKKNIRSERVDDIQFTGKITEKIQGCIEMSEFVIADLSWERPNVYYEVGYADACDKPLILIAKEGTNLHFDLRNDNTLFYKGITHLEKLISDAIDGIRHNQAT